MAKIRSSGPRTRSILWLVLLLLFVFLGVGLIAACLPSSDRPVQEQPTQQQDVPDCDFDDVLERDTDCGFVKPQSKKPAPKVTVKQPAPRVTRR